MTCNIMQSLTIVLEQVKQIYTVLLCWDCVRQALIYIKAFFSPVAPTVPWITLYCCYQQLNTAIEQTLLDFLVILLLGSGKNAWFLKENLHLAHNNYYIIIRSARHHVLMNGCTKDKCRGLEFSFLLSDAFTYSFPLFISNHCVLILL